MREPVAGRWAAQVVDEDVEAAERLGGASDDLGRRGGVHQVDGDVQHLAVQCRERRARRGDDARTLGEEGAHDREADALGGAGDDRHAAVEFKIHAPLNAPAARSVRSASVEFHNLWL